MKSSLVFSLAALFAASVFADQIYPPRPGYNNGDYQSPSGCFTKPGLAISITNSTEQCTVDGTNIYAHIWPSGNPIGYFFDPTVPLTNVVSCGTMFSFATTAFSSSKMYWPSGGTISWTDAGYWWTVTNPPTPYSLAAAPYKWRYQADGFAYMFCQQIENKLIETLPIHKDSSLPIFPPQKTPITTNVPPFKTPPTFTAPQMVRNYIQAYPLALGDVVNDTDVAQVWSSTNLSPSAWTLSASVAVSTNNLLVDPNNNIPSVSLTNVTITLPPGTNGPIFWRTVINSNAISPLQCLYILPVPSFQAVSAAGQLVQFEDDYSLSNHFSSTPSDYFITAGADASTWPEWDCVGSNRWTGDFKNVLPYGKGMWYGSSSYSNEALVFQGAVSIGTNDLAIHAGRNCLAWPRPEAVNLGTSRLPSSPGDVVSVWSAPIQDFHTYTNVSGTWTPPLPVLQIGDSFILDTTNSSVWPIWFYDPLLYLVTFAPASTVTNILSVTCANGLTHPYNLTNFVCCIGDNITFQDSRLSGSFTNLDFGTFTVSDLADDAIMTVDPVASHGGNHGGNWQPASITSQVSLTAYPDTVAASANVNAH